MYCKNCGVELEDSVLHCPLCGERVAGSGAAGGIEIPAPGQQPYTPGHGKMSPPQKKFTWEIVSIILLSAVIATLSIDFIINKRITWSEYPAGVSLIVFSYVSLFAFWNRRTVTEMAGGFVVSSFFFIVLDALTGGIRWSVKLGIPLLFLRNLVVAVLITVIRLSKYKGVNLIAYAFLGAVVLCIGIESVLSFFQTGSLRLEWSVIVAACTLPVVMVLFFVHFRLKRGRSLERIFHI